jgi:hypothetical protein
MLIALAVALSAEGSFAESSLLPLNALPDNPTLNLTSKTTAKKVEVALDDDGNLIFRRGKVSLTLIYGADEAADAIRERSGLVPPVKEAARISAIIRVGMLF